MCIAIYSPKGNDIPCETFLHNCFDNNSDGAGFAFNHNGHVETVKGFMNWHDFISAFNEYNKAYSFIDKGVLIHFRIATHGKVDKANCHPFPVTDKDKQLRKSKTCSEYACVHNGIISLTSNEDKNYSDTFIFVRDYLSKIASNKGWFSNSKNIELIYNLIQSKMAILNSNGDIISTPGFKPGPDGNFYSNESYSYSYCYDLTHKEPLMILRRGESILYDDGDVEEYDNDYPVMASKDGEIFFLYNGCFNSTVFFDDLIYTGEGIFIDNNSLKPVEFREDIICKGGYNYGYAL